MVVVLPCLPHYATQQGKRDNNMPLFESLTASLVAGTTVALLNRFLINNPKAPCNKHRDDDDGGSSSSTAVSVEACHGGESCVREERRCVRRSRTPCDNIQHIRTSIAKKRGSFHFYRSRNSKRPNASPSRAVFRDWQHRSRIFGCWLASDECGH